MAKLRTGVLRNARYRPGVLNRPPPMLAVLYHPISNDQILSCIVDSISINEYCSCEQVGTIMCYSIKKGTNGGKSNNTTLLLEWSDSLSNE